MRKARVYPLAEADAPRENEWMNIAALVFNSIHANDFGFFEELDELIREVAA